MGVSTDAYLMYGYDLGCEDGWLIKGLDENDAWEPDWLAHVDDDPEARFDYVESVERKLLAAGTSLGVKLETHCSGQYEMFILSAETISASRGRPKQIEPAMLQAQLTDGAMDRDLAAALEVLGIKPLQDKPSWILASYYSC